MSITLRIPDALTGDSAGARELTLDPGADATLADVLACLRAEHPALARRLCDETGALRRYVNVYVGPDESRTLKGLGTPVPPGSALLVAGSVAGG